MSAQLVVITQNQNSLEKAEALSRLLQRELNCTSSGVEKYEKWDNSYRLSFDLKFEDGKDRARSAIEISSILFQPWLLTVNKLDNSVSLIFNKSEHCSFANQNFNVIVWAQLEATV